MIKVTGEGVTIAIEEVLHARQLWDLSRQISDALFQYRDLIGKERFQQEMGNDPEEKL